MNRSVFILRSLLVSAVRRIQPRFLLAAARMRAALFFWFAIAVSFCQDKYTITGSYIYIVDQKQASSSSTKIDSRFITSFVSIELKNFEHGTAISSISRNMSKFHG
jgi:hypothetical protein